MLRGGIILKVKEQYKAMDIEIVWLTAEDIVAASKGDNDLEWDWF